MAQDFIKPLAMRHLGEIPMKTSKVALKMPYI